MRNGLKKLFLKLICLVIISIFSYIFFDIENYDHLKSKNK